MKKNQRPWLVFFGALLVSVPLRACQLLFFVNYETGFFTDNGVISISLTLFLLCACAVIMLMCVREKNAPKRSPAIRNFFAGGTAGLAGVMALLHSGLTLAGFAKPPAGTLMAASAGQKYLSLILGMLGLVAGVIWLVTALGYFRGRNFFREMPYFALVPPVWLALNLVALILSYTTYANFTENIYDMLAVMLMLLFVFTRAKLLAGVRLTSTGRRLYLFGLPAILLTLMTALPNLILHLLGKAPVSGLSLTFSLVLLALALYGGVHLWVLQAVPDIDKEEEPQEDAAEPETLSEPEDEAEPAPRAPRPVPKWEQQEEEPDVEEIIDLPKTPAIYKFKDPPRKKKKKKKKKKKQPLLKRLLAAIRRLFEGPKPPEEPAAWKPSQLDEPATKTLDADWFLDYYGFERKDGKPYVPQVHDLVPPEQETASRPEQTPKGEEKQ